MTYYLTLVNILLQNPKIELTISLGEKLSKIKLKSLRFFIKGWKEYSSVVDCLHHMHTWHIISPSSVLKSKILGKYKQSRSAMHGRQQCEPYGILSPAATARATDTIVITTGAGSLAQKKKTQHWVFSYSASVWMSMPSLLSYFYYRGTITDLLSIQSWKTVNIWLIGFLKYESFYVNNFISTTLCKNRVLNTSELYNLKTVLKNMS